MNCRQELPGVIHEQYPIDTTVEIQLRTVFSEGWHEVDGTISAINPNPTGQEVQI